jgi:hypothetical protein
MKRVALATIASLVLGATAYANGTWYLVVPPYDNKTHTANTEVPRSEWYPAQDTDCDGRCDGTNWPRYPVVWHVVETYTPQECQAELRDLQGRTAKYSGSDWDALKYAKCVSSDEVKCTPFVQRYRFDVATGWQLPTDDYTPGKCTPRALRTRVEPAR